MNIFGLSITKATDPTLHPPVVDRNPWLNNWFGVVQEPFTGAWQRNMDLRLTNVLSYWAIYSCVTLIASDIGKVRLCLVEDKAGSDIWEDVEVPAFSPVLKKPNRYQTRQKFIEQWIVSKLTQGNTYILKERDNRNVVTALYVLDPQRCCVLIAPDGEVFYELHSSDLAGVAEENITVPASEIIHDVMTPLYHPLLGVTPLTACGLAAVQAMNITRQSSTFFANGARPSGILTAPALISDETAKRLKAEWERNYSGNSAGKVAVLGDGLEYKPMTVNATDAQLVEQLKWSPIEVCGCFHVPPYMIGAGAPPSYNNSEVLYQQYYSQCLQSLMDSIEELLDFGLGLVNVPDHIYGTEFKLDDLLKMDTATQVKTYGEGVSRSIFAPNEARAKLNMKPKKGGDSPLSQQQYYSLEALAERDANQPFAKPTPAAPAIAPPAEEPEVEDTQEQSIKLLERPKLTSDEIYGLLGA